MEGNHFRSSGSMPALQQNSQTSKEIRVDISIFVGPSIQSSFFGILCKCLDRNLCCFCPSSYDTRCLVNWIYQDFKISPNHFFPPRQPMHLQDTYVNKKLLASAVLYKPRGSEAG